MKDEVRRISKLVAEGRLTPEDAADLIDAFYAGQNEMESDSEIEEPVAAHAGGSTSTSAPPNGHAKDSFRAFVENFERLTKEGIESVNWSEVSQQAKSFGKKGVDALRTGLDELSKGKVNLQWLRSSETKEVTMPLSIPTGKSLRIENASGPVKVVGGFDAGSVMASARIRGASADDAKAKAERYSLVIEESEAWVTVRQPDMSGLEVTLEIQMPGSAPVEVRGESGDVLILDTKAGAKVTTKSGDVRVRGLNGSIELTTESGDLSLEDTTATMVIAENKSGQIKVRNVHGVTNLRTQNGHVEVRGSTSKVLSIETVAGPVDLDSDQPITGSLNIRTVNGDILIAIGDGSDCRVSLSTLRGVAKSSIALADEKRTDERITGRLGAGSGSIDVSAIMGNITFELHDSAKA